MKDKAPTRRSVTSSKIPGKPLSPEEFAKAVAAALTAVSDPALRAGMRAYMKDQFEFLGVKTPVRRAAVSGLIRGQKNATAGSLLRIARVLWAMPER